jgi:hypothetical protein
LIYHPNPTIFIENATEFGALGKTLVALSNLEFAHDEFVFKMYEANKELSIRLSNRFPRHFKEKTDFLIHSIANVSKLKQVPIFQTGKLDLIWLQYQLDELYEVRSILSHGSVFFSETTPERITWCFERFVSNKRNTWSREAVKVSNGYLASVYLTASTLRNYLWDLTACLQGTSSWEKDYQTDKEIRKNRILLNEIDAFMTIADDNKIMDIFRPLGPVE